MTTPHIICATDRAGWTFENVAKQHSRPLTEWYRFTVAPYQTLTKGSCDLVNVLWWPALLQLKANLKSQGFVVCLYDGLSWRVDEGSRHQFRLVLRNADALVAANKRLLEDALSFAGADAPPGYAIPDGVDTELFRQLPLPRAFTLGWCGNLQRDTPGAPPDVKGSRILREAQKLTGVPLHILDAASGNPWPLHKMPTFYQDISCVLCASSTEGTPNPVLEGLACGRAVISTPVGIVPDIIKDGVNGFIVERTPEAFATAISKLAAMPPEHLRKMGSAARRSVQKWTWQDRAPLWRSCYNATLTQVRVRGPRTAAVPKALVPVQRLEGSSLPASTFLSGGYSTSASKRREMENAELHSKTHSVPHLQAFIDALSITRETLPQSRPLIWILSTYRFLSRTLRIVEHLVDRFRVEIHTAEDVYHHFASSPNLPDLVWTCYPFQDSAAARLLWSIHKIPYVTTARGQFWHFSPEMVDSAVRTYSEARRIVSLTETIANNMKNKFLEIKTPICIIPNGCYEVDDAEAKFVLPDVPKPHIVVLTNLNFGLKRRAVDHLLDAATVCSNFTGTILVAGQSGHYAYDRGPIVGGKGYYLGYVKSKFALLSQADAFLYHSYHDSQPSTVMEALSMGCLCAVGRTSGSGAHEFIVDGETGIVFTRPLEGLQRLLATLDDDTETARLKAGAKRSAGEVYTWRAAAEAYADLFAEVIAESRESTQ